MPCCSAGLEPCESSFLFSRAEDNFASEGKEEERERERARLQRSEVGVERVAQVANMKNLGSSCSIPRIFAEEAEGVENRFFFFVSARASCGPPHFRLSRGKRSRSALCRSRTVTAQRSASRRRSCPSTPHREIFSRRTLVPGGCDRRLQSTGRGTRATPCNRSSDAGRTRSRERNLEKATDRIEEKSD